MASVKMVSVHRTTGSLVHQVAQHKDMEIKVLTTATMDGGSGMMRSSTSTGKGECETEKEALVDWQATKEARSMAV